MPCDGFGFSNVTLCANSRGRHVDFIVSGSTGGPVFDVEVYLYRQIKTEGAGVIAWRTGSISGRSGFGDTFTDVRSVPGAEIYAVATIRSNYGTSYTASTKAWVH